jgi:hypothetical protein
MPHRRHTITVASSTLFFVCLALHAQARLHSQASIPCNDTEACKVYESLLPDWTLTVAHARRLLIQAQTGRTDFCLKAAPESAAFLQPLFDSFVAHSKTSSVLQPKLNLSAPYGFTSRADRIYESMRWRGTSRAWAS